MTAAAKRGRSSATGRPRREFWVELPIWLLVLIVPLVFDPNGKDVFRDVKLHVAQILALWSLAVLLWKLVSSDRTSTLREWSALPGLRIAFLISLGATLSLLVSQQIEYSVSALFELLIAICCFAAWSLRWESSTLRRWIQALVAPAVILAAIGLLQFHDLWSPLDFASVEKLGRGRITSLAGASGDLASFLILPILVLQASIHRKKKAHWPLILALLLLVYAQVLTQNLTALIAMAAGTTLFWALSLPKRDFLRRGGGLLALVLVALVAFAPLRDRVGSIATVLSKGKLNVAFSGRLDAWQAAHRMWLDHPVLGVGHGVFRAEFGRTKLELHREGEEFFRGHIFSNFSIAHNDLLQALAEWGAVGFLALGLAIYLLLRELIQLSSATEKARTERSLAMAGVFSISLVSITYFPLHLALTAYPFLLFLAWILALRREQESTAE